MGSMCFQDMDCTQSGTIEAFQDTSLGCIIATSNFFIIVGLNYFRLSVSYHSESLFREGDAETLVLTSCVLGLFEGSCYYYLLWGADQFIDTLARAALGAIRDNDGLYSAACPVSELVSVSVSVLPDSRSGKISHGRWPGRVR